VADISIGEFFDPEAPEFKGLVKKANAYFKQKKEKTAQLTLDTGEPVKAHGFGRFSGLPPEIPTLNELVITQYLAKNGIKYQTHATFDQLFPSEIPEHPDIEYDIYIPEKLIAVEISPKWHDPEKIKKYITRKDTPTEARKNLTRVLRNDELKAEVARSHGIDLIVIDPTEDVNVFASRINKSLVPVLRVAGYHVPELHIDSRSKAIANAQRRSEA